MKLIVQALLIGFLVSSTLPILAQKPESLSFNKRHQIDDYCGSDMRTEEVPRSPTNEGAERWTGCGATLSTCYSSCTPTIPTCKYRVPIVFTIITDGSGASLLGSDEGEVLAHIDAALARCNNYYAGAGIEFVQCQAPRNADGTDSDFNSADLYAFDASSPDLDDDQLDALHIDNVINVYIAPEVTSSSGNDVCGYASYPGMFTNGYVHDQNLRSVLKTSCFVGDETTLEHELGHFFGLPHTHNGASSSTPNEASDGSDACNYTLYNGSTYSYNFSSADIGDGVADTSPDPNLSGDVSSTCAYTGSYSPHASQPLPFDNIMSYSTDFYCAKMIFTACQLEKIQATLLSCRDYLFCESATPELMDANIDICQGSKSPTFMANSSCYSWYSAASGGTALESSSQYFTPPMSSTDLNTVGTYTYYVEYDNEFYSTNFSGSAYDTYSGHSTSPANKRKAITITVNGGACNSTPGDGVDNCNILICESSCTFTTSGANFAAPFNSADFRTGWAISSADDINSQSAIDALPVAQVFGPYDTSTPDHSFTNTCTGGVPDLAVGSYYATPFASKVASGATTTTFSSGVLSRTLDENNFVAEEITATGLPDNATVKQICVTLTHSYAGITSINAGAPDGMGQVILVNRIGYPANKPFGYPSNFSGTYCFEGGAASFPEPSGNTNIATGTYAPHDTDFSAFAPKNPNGNWALAIASPIAGASGTLTGWSIEFDVPAIVFPAIDRTAEGSFGASIPFEVALSLPVNLTTFEGRLASRGIELQWTTESEENNSHFLLQRSRGGVVFETIAEVKGAGTSLHTNNYAHLDTDPFSGINYYRLISVDFDGSVEGSEVISLDQSTNKRLQIAPNPIAGNRIQATFETDSSSEISIEVRSVNGQLIKHLTQKVYDGKNVIQFSAEELNSGVYFFVLRNDGVEMIERFLKK